MQHPILYACPTVTAEGLAITVQSVTCLFEVMRPTKEGVGDCICAGENVVLWIGSFACGTAMFQVFQTIFCQFLTSACTWHQHPGVMFQWLLSALL